jgi:hypothetical protein
VDLHERAARPGRSPNGSGRCRGKQGAGDPQSKALVLVQSSACNRQRLARRPARGRFGRDEPDNRGGKKTNNDARLNCFDDMHRLPLSAAPFTVHHIRGESEPPVMF